MTKLLFAIAFSLGATAIVWVGLDFAGSDGLALLVTAVIAAGYLIGVIELLQFRRATSTLVTALPAAPEQTAQTQDPAAGLEAWLARLHPSLQNSVRMRIEGERAGLPAPVFTPYLVGLLVMLGLLGTFIGMVETLGGAVLALEGSTELATIRAGLAAPIKGLGVAFGTSVAGVAASAMLGLMSTLCRQERMLATRQLDRKAATVFREFSPVYQRQETLRALQLQAQALPAAADTLQAVAGQLERMGERLGESLSADQALFHTQASTAYKELAASVDSSLKTSLAESGRQAGASITPVIADAMAGISRDAQVTQEQLASAAKTQLTALSKDSTAANSAMLASFEQASSTWLAGQQEQMSALTGTIRTELEALRNNEAQSQQAALARLEKLEGTVAGHLLKLGQGLEEPMTRLIQTASETPRAAAEVIALLRAEISSNIERDNQLLEERARVLEQLNTLAGSLETAAGRQHEAIEGLVGSSTSMLQDVSARFGDQVGGGVDKLASVAEHFAGSAAELASLGEAFSLGVSLFAESNEKLIDNLAQLEESMQGASARSDDQMGYYVAQAREIIDQSMNSQKEIINDLRRIGQPEPLAPAEAL